MPNFQIALKQIKKTDQGYLLESVSRCIPLVAFELDMSTDYPVQTSNPFQVLIASMEVVLNNIDFTTFQKSYNLDIPSSSAKILNLLVYEEI